MAPDPRAPVIVAVAQQTWREPDTQRTPVDALHAVAEQALKDSGCASLAQSIDAFATVRFITDTNPQLIPLLPRNPGLLLSRRLGIGNAAFFQTDAGGNTPQFLVNHFAARLAAGEVNAVLISGAELMNSFFDAMRSGGDISGWKGEDTDLPEMIGEEKDGVSPLEKAHGFYEPINTYPVFESALRHHLGTAPEEHRALIAQLCSNMSAVAQDNPLAWKPNALSADEIAAVTDRNRYIGYPYTKAMNALLSVDMAAAVIMTTAGRAAELGIDPGRIVYLRAGADVNDIWHISEREALYEAPAIGLASGSALAQAGLALEDIDHFDIYSCVPSAVEIACNEIGLSPLDPRGVTVTGGLPFFGGPGNNYTLHAVAEMADQLRGRTNAHGLVTANGLYLTKHSLGIYSTEPPPGRWTPVDSAALQRQIDAQPRATVAGDPAGPVTVEAYTVAFDRSGPSRGIIIARNGGNERVLANATDADTVQALLADDPVGRRGTVSPADDINRFTF